MHHSHNTQKLNPIKKRQLLLSVLSKSAFNDIDNFWQTLSITPSYTLLKTPEVGMTMVRAKTGGAGQEFNMGEMTVTRTVIRLDSIESCSESEKTQAGIIGFGYTAGRETKKSELIAVIDACFQLSAYAELIEEKILQPLSEQLQEKETLQSEKVDSTKVNFFTMVRGE